jgi:hypothetical protein
VIPAVAARPPAAAAAVPAMDPLKTLDALPDLTRQLEARHPSMGMGLTGPDDLRLGRFVREVRVPFKLASHVVGTTAASYILVDPTRRSGFLWWRRATVVVARAEELQAARAGQAPLSPEVVSFLSKVAPGTGA